MTASLRPFYFLLHPQSILCGLLVCAFGCGTEDTTTADPPVPVAGDPVTDETAADEPQASDPAASADGAYQTTISGFEFTVPAGWREAELRPEQQGFIDARYEIPAAGEEVGLTFTTSGGGVQANVDRWIGQFTLPEGVEPVIETLTVDGIAVTWVELRGTFDAGAGRPFGGGDPPKENWMMIGVAYEGQPQQFFIKLTGPSAVVEGLKADFRGMVESARVQ